MEKSCENEIFADSSLQYARYMGGLVPVEITSNYSFRCSGGQVWYPWKLKARVLCYKLSYLDMKTTEPNRILNIPVCQLEMVSVLLVVSKTANICV